MDQYQDQYAYQSRNPKGKFDSPKYPRPLQINFRGVKAHWQTVRRKAAKYETTAQALLNDVISELYIDFVTCGQLPPRAPIQIPTYRVSLRVDAARLSMLHEMANAADISVSALLRDIIAFTAI